MIVAGQTNIQNYYRAESPVRNPPSPTIELQLAFRGALRFSSSRPSSLHCSWLRHEFSVYADGLPYSEDRQSPQPGFPLRHWSIQITLLHQESKQEVPAECLQKVTYNLHPSFGPRQMQGTFYPTPPRTAVGRCPLISDHSGCGC